VKVCRCAPAFSLVSLLQDSTITVKVWPDLGVLPQRHHNSKFGQTCSFLPYMGDMICHSAWTLACKSTPCNHCHVPYLTLFCSNCPVFELLGMLNLIYNCTLVKTENQCTGRCVYNLMNSCINSVILCRYKWLLFIFISLVDVEIMSNCLQRYFRLVYQRYFHACLMIH